MHLYEHTFPSAAQNIACDEALLEWREARGGPDILRLWQPEALCVVMGYTNRLEYEADAAACRRDGVPIMRRVSGGGTVLHGPGSLCYAVILDSEKNPEIANITSTNCFVMRRLQEASAALYGRPVHICGYTDLAMDERKFSGNAQRRKRRYVLFHGTFLLSMDLDAIGKYLPYPSHSPAYRAGRKHSEFLANLPVPVDALKARLCLDWGADTMLKHPPLRQIEELVQLKYATREWIEHF